jgi:hypothetical protein
MNGGFLERKNREDRTARKPVGVSLAAVAAFACQLAACTRAAPPPPAAAWTVTFATAPSPAGDASAQPQLTASGDGIILSWLEHGSSQTALKFAERTAAGWSEPRLVAFGDFFSNYADVPSVVRLADRTLAAHWLQMNGTSATGYDLRLSRSSDEGRTWSAPVSPHHDGTKMQHGFATLFDSAGGLGVVWLDGRNMKPGAGPDDDGIGDMSLRGARFERDGRQVSEQAIDLRVCDCCPTASAVTTDGPIIAYRNRSPEEVRDIYVSRFTGEAWTVPAPVHADGWKINGCPVNGPALSARLREVAVAWFTAPGDEGHAFVAFSHDSGRTFGAPIRVDEAASLGRVDVEQLADGSAIVGWLELNGRSAAFKLRRVQPGGERSAAVTVVDLGASRNSGYPRMARAGQELIVAWAGADSLKVETAVARLPE